MLTHVSYSFYGNILLFSQMACHHPGLCLFWCDRSYTPPILCQSDEKQVVAFHWSVQKDCCLWSGLMDDIRHFKTLADSNHGCISLAVTLTLRLWYYVQYALHGGHMASAGKVGCWQYIRIHLLVINHSGLSASYVCRIYWVLQLPITTDASQWEALALKTLTLPLLWHIFHIFSLL